MGGGLGVALGASKLLTYVLVRMAHGHVTTPVALAVGFALAVVWTRYGIYIERVRTSRAEGPA